jgi:site-specific recombinase XerC
MRGAPHVEFSATMRKIGAAWDQFDTQAGQVRRSVYIPDSTSDRNFGEAQDGAMLALLLGSGLRRSEVVGLRLDQLQLREDHWVIVDLVGKGGRVRRSSLFPPENATGNYVKIVQWLPVRIRFKPNQRDLDKLRPGESVEPKVHLD